MDLLGLGTFVFRKLDLMIVIILLHSLSCAFMLLQQLHFFVEAQHKTEELFCIYVSSYMY